MVTACCLCLVGGIAAQDTDRPQPFFDARSHQTEYAGPTGVVLKSSQVDEVRIGYFGPSDRTHPIGGRLWEAAQLAIRHANQEGGFQGIPFRLVPAWSDNPWGSGVTQLTHLVYDDQVWAMVGGIDGSSTHLAEQVVAKARLVLVSPVSTDKTVNLANVPWMFSLAPNDRLMAETLVPAILASKGADDLIVIAETDHDSHLQAVEIVRQLARHHKTPRHRFDFTGPPFELDLLLQECLRYEPATILLVAQPANAARLVSKLRQQGFEGLVFGGSAMGRVQFREAAQSAADGVVFPSVATCRDRLLNRGDGSSDQVACCPSSDATRPNSKNSATESGPPPWDTAACQTYDAVRLVTTAICRAGLNRAEIERSLRRLSPWHGRSGVVAWDGLGNNTTVPRLAIIRDQHVLPYEIPANELIGEANSHAPNSQ